MKQQNFELIRKGNIITIEEVYAVQPAHKLRLTQLSRFLQTVPVCKINS